MLSFRETLQRHLDAIQNRDLDALADTVAEEALMLIMADGRLTHSTQEFLEAHRAWFGMDNWTLQADLVEVFESADLGVAVLALDYREPPSVRSESHLTLVFERFDDQWRMVLDQNTPIK